MSKRTKAVEATEPEPMVITSVAFVKVPKSNDWAVLTISVQGDKVIGIQSSQPNMKMIAIEDLKMTVMRTLIDSTNE